MTSLKFKSERRGVHVHVDVFVGPDADHQVLSGRLVFTVDEWAVLRPFAGEVETLVRVYLPADEVAFELPRET